MKRLFDFTLAVLLLIILAFPMFLIAIIVSLTTKGSFIYYSDRVGRNNIIFKMPKFRSMHEDAPVLATHLMKNPDRFFSPVGNFIRRSSLDELPQLFSILKGDMSFVGPRPALFNQDNLITLRKKKGVDKLQPGVTGWAQINGRDNLSIPEKVTFDVYYLNRRSFWFDVKILWMTLLVVLKRNNIAH